MNKRFFFRSIIAVISVAVCLTGTMSITSCKKDASDLVDKNSEGIPPASPDAVIAPEANISGPELSETPAAPPADGKYPVMTFVSNEHDFGTINKGDTVTHQFEFKNTGEADLVISDARASCGCTVPEYPKEPIKPGASGKITVSFNSTGKNGKQNKTVTLVTNTESGKEKITVKSTIKSEDKK